MRRFSTWLGLSLLAVGTVVAADPEVTEEAFGDRIYFMADGFERGDYFDYCRRPFLGKVMRNREGRGGHVLWVVYAETRPMVVTGGKACQVSFLAFNEGAKKKLDLPAGTKPTPFLKNVTFWDDGWKKVSSLDGAELIGDAIPEARWKEYSFEVTPPTGATMMTISFHCNTRIGLGPFLIDDLFIKVKEGIQQ